MSLTLTLPLDVPVRPMDAKGLTLPVPQDMPYVIKKKVKVKGSDRNISYIAWFLTYFHGYRKISLVIWLEKKKVSKLISLA